MFRLSERHEFHSLEQIAFVQQMSLRADLPPREALYVATQLVNHGFPGAGEYLSTVEARLPSRAARDYVERLKKRHAVIQSVPQLEAFRSDQQSLEELYRMEGFVFRPGARIKDVAVVIFTTKYNNFGFSNLVLDAMIAELGVARLFVKDTTDAFYFRGVKDICGNLRDLPAELARLLRERGIRNQIIAGYSSGGYPALYVATRVNNMGYLGYSTHTDVSPDTALPVRPYYERFRNGDEAVDLKDLRNDAVRVGTACLIHYGERDPVDRAQAQHFSGIGSVKLMGHGAAGHEVTTYLLEQEDFMSSFSHLLNKEADSD